MTGTNAKHAQDLKNKIVEEIKASGYPLELDVVEAFQSAGWVTTHGSMYLDADEQKPREIDVVAYKVHEAGERDGRRYGLTCAAVVECKRSDRPWVFFVRESSDQHDHLYFRPASMISNLVRAVGEANIRNALWYRKSLLRANTYFEPFAKRNENPQKVYAALSSVTKAALFEENRFKNVKIPSLIFVCFPIIVFGGTLFEAKVKGEDIDLTDVAHVLVNFERMLAEGGGQITRFLVDVILRTTCRHPYLESRIP
ncbi:MAG: hypothetical protein HYS09_02750 [Chloroflexi bacterium]|nr:hypothetical protein [Chloroflexota bacterium]